MSNKLLSLIFIITILFLIIGIIVIQNLEPISEDKEQIVIKISLEKCSPQKKICNIGLNEFDIKISFDKDIYYLKPFYVSVLTESNNNINPELVYVDFKMKNMDMGVNRFKLKKIKSINKQQSWQGKALLPVCVTGRADWFSELEVVTKQNKYIISFPISVQRATN